MYLFEPVFFKGKVTHFFNGKQKRKPFQAPFFVIIFQNLYAIQKITINCTDNIRRNMDKG